MEIKDPVHGTITLSQAESKVVDSRAFQRLRLIKQLGFSEFSFPGATHSRYLHSLGVTHIAGLAFDSIFKNHTFSSPGVRERFRQVLRLAAMLHDIGHGPLSHATEEVMPLLKDLKINIYQQMPGLSRDAKASHEDYTIKFLMDSQLTDIIKTQFPDINPYYVAALIDRRLKVQDDFFIDEGLNYRTILSQLVSSEIDVDRMDYLERDAFFCGTNYGHVEMNWLLSNFTFHVDKNEVYLALNKRALYTFDDFLISRHHMYLMIYFHHKSIIYEEMLYRYLTSIDCTYELPADIDEYLTCTDYSLYEHLAASKNYWAQKIARRQPLKVLFENHVTHDDPKMGQLTRLLKEAGIDFIAASSQARLSKYHGTTEDSKSISIYVVDQYSPGEEPITIDKCTEIFKMYEKTRKIERIYVPQEVLEVSRAVREKVFRKKT
ncbi:MAG: HD domain-containing protein [Bdellovibrionaceae bacterium]|nr:HD domain-containing protein [Pseudobdellovibrionaceae bacterium]